MSEKKKKEPVFYAVCRGHNPGLYEIWEEAEKQIKGFAGSYVKKYTTREEALHKLWAAGIMPSRNKPIPDVSFCYPKMPTESDHLSIYIAGYYDQKTARAGFGIVFSDPRIAPISERLHRRKETMRAAYLAAAIVGIKCCMHFIGEQNSWANISEYISGEKDKKPYKVIDVRTNYKFLLVADKYVHQLIDGTIAKQEGFTVDSIKEHRALLMRLVELKYHEPGMHSQVIFRELHNAKQPGLVAAEMLARAGCEEDQFMHCPRLKSYEVDDML
jgi:hypothetical protein